MIYAINGTIKLSQFTFLKDLKGFAVYLKGSNRLARLLKVCIVTPTFLPRIGGAEIGIYELSQRLLKRGHYVTLITPRFGEMKTREEIDGIEIYRFPTSRNFGGIFTGLAPFYKLLPKLNPDIVNMHYIVPTGYCSTMVCKTFQIPTVLSLIGWDVISPRASARPFMKLLMKNVKRIACISSYVMQRALELGAPPSRTEVVPFGVDVNQFNPQIDGKSVREMYGVRDKTIVLAVQRISPRKAVEYLIYAIPIVLRTFPETIFFIIDGGEKMKKLEKMARKLKIADKTIFVDSAPRSMLPKYYAAADIFVLHSLSEALGLVLLEAMSSGKPVVTTRAGGMIDVVEDGKTGFLVKPKNPTELAKAIGILIKDKQLRKKMGRNGRIKAVKNFSWENIAHRMLKIYLEAME